MSKKLLKKKNKIIRVTFLAGLLSGALLLTGCEGDWEKNLPFEPLHIQVTMPTPEGTPPEVAEPQPEQLSQEPVIEDLQPIKEMQWLTYSNSKNKFALKYPETWTVAEGQGGNNVSFKIPGREDVRLLVIASISPDATPTFNKLVARREGERKAVFPDLVIVRQDSLAVSGGHALRKTWEYTESNREISFSGTVRESAAFYLKDKMEYTVYATAPKQIVGAAEMYFAEMINSFQFL